MLLGQLVQLLLPARLELAEGARHFVLERAEASLVVLGYLGDRPLQRGVAQPQRVQAFLQLCAPLHVRVVTLHNGAELALQLLTKVLQSSLPPLLLALLQRAEGLGELVSSSLPILLTAGKVLSQPAQLRLDGVVQPRLRVCTGLLEGGHLLLHLRQPVLQLVKLLPDVVPHVLHQLRLLLVNGLERLWTSNVLLLGRDGWQSAGTSRLQALAPRGCRHRGEGGPGGSPLEVCASSGRKGSRTRDCGSNGTGNRRTGAVVPMRLAAAQALPCSDGTGKR
mmetsp:Transcript_102076/g.304656  ORF Transcript_102076/g.304656 Transcript_102076/m.304656 type:complete len:279 (-) Transcript_102076:239-1075(-)